MGEIYKRLMQAIAHVGAGALLIVYNALTFSAVSIIFGVIFIMVGYLIAVTAIMQKIPGWLNWLEKTFALVLYMAALVSLIIISIDGITDHLILFFAVALFVMMLPIIQFIDLVKSK